jgi:hypothetical protein
MRFSSEPNFSELNPGQGRVSCAGTRQKAHGSEMSGFTLPVQRPNGTALVVANDACREFPIGVLEQLGYQCAATGSPYEAMAELSRNSGMYQSLILSLQSLYREELAVIPAAKRHVPGLEVWVCQTDGRAATLAEALNLGADGLLSEEGLHRFAAVKKDEAAQAAPPPVAVPAPAPPAAQSLASRSEGRGYVVESGESDSGPLLSAEELRALLQDHPLRP